MNHRVASFTADGRPVRRWGSLGDAPGQLHHPWGVSVGPDGDVWVGDMTNGRIQRFHSDGKLVGVFGSQGRALGQFDHPKTVDATAGEVVVSNPGNHAVDFLRGDVGAKPRKKP